MAPLIAPKLSDNLSMGTTALAGPSECHRSCGSRCWQGMRVCMQMSGAGTANWCTRRDMALERTYFGGRGTGGARRMRWTHGWPRGSFITMTKILAPARNARTTPRSSGAQRSVWGALRSFAVGVTPSSPVSTIHRGITPTLGLTRYCSSYGLVYLCLVLLLLILLFHCFYCCKRIYKYNYFKLAKLIKRTLNWWNKAKITISVLWLWLQDLT